MAMQKARFPVQGMHCSACVKRIERALSRTQGVAAANVDLAAGQAEVEYAPETVSLPQIQETVRGLGFQVPGQD
jgi:P-type Cu+ transporter